MPESPEVTHHFHPVLKASALPEGRPVRVELAGKAYALWRDRDGAPRAFLDRCPHRWAPLSRGIVRPDGRLQCRYHGWAFDAEGAGRCPSQPSLPCSVPTFQLGEHHGWLWLAEPSVEPQGLPDLEAPGFRLAGSLAMEAKAPLHVVFDNFNEDEHTPFIHGRLGWDEHDASKIEFSTSTHADHIDVSYAAPQRASVLLPLVLIRQGDTFHNDWVARFSPLHILYTLSWADSRTGARRPLTMRFGIFFVPLDSLRTRIVAFVFTRIEGRLQALQGAIDKVILGMAWKEIFDDARWVRAIAQTPYLHTGMRLDRYDAPLVRSRKLIDRLYYGRANAAEMDATG
jgi:phenylpropionate dioxygenase-like ring-hydroxylating dioxygenase large terminal subunit